ncbi:hypothetical protein BZG36_01232 [Bifiguratus adelaidae]|uniref:Uncharacterized protein n=1 Tax=Bifiguratus adelaidae TaxID=1938954 RepID=A0A261Y5V8_9FUNG|nr:hypothetical protein BZG36_01232 [Bifiguratus adelaidae]
MATFPPNTVPREETYLPPRVSPEQQRYEANTFPGAHYLPQMMYTPTVMPNVMQLQPTYYAAPIVTSQMIGGPVPTPVMTQPSPMVISQSSIGGPSPMVPRPEPVVEVPPPPLPFYRTYMEHPPLHWINGLAMLGTVVLPFVIIILCGITLNPANYETTYAGQPISLPANFLVCNQPLKAFLIGSIVVSVLVMLFGGMMMMATVPHRFRRVGVGASAILIIALVWVILGGVWIGNTLPGPSCEARLYNFSYYVMILLAVDVGWNIVTWGILRTMLWLYF